MKKLFMSIAASAISICGISAEGKASPGWAVAMASEGCRLMKQGMTAAEAGKASTEYILQTPYASDLRAADNNGTFPKLIKAELNRQCRSAFN